MSAPHVPPIAQACTRRARAAELLRFGVAGLANTIFGFAAYSALVLLGLRPSIALLIATVVGIFFNFATFGGYAFRRLHARRFPGFLLAYGCIYLFNLALLTGLRAVSDLGPIPAQLACLIVVAPTAYLVLRMKVFHDSGE